MNSEARAATALLIYSGLLTLTIVLWILGASGTVVKGMLAFSVTLTLVWCLGPTLLRIVSSGRHSG